MRPIWLLPLVVMTISCGCGHVSPFQQAAYHTHVDKAEYILPSHDTCQRGLQTLVGTATKLGIPVTFDYPLEADEFGRFWYEERRIELRPDLNSCGQLEILGHELSHAVEPKALHASMHAELLADLVSLELTKRLGGYDPSERYGRFWAGRKYLVRDAEFLQPEVTTALTHILGR